MLCEFSYIPVYLASNRVIVTLFRVVVKVYFFLRGVFRLGGFCLALRRLFFSLSRGVCFDMVIVPIYLLVNCPLYHLNLGMPCKFTTIVDLNFNKHRAKSC